MADWREHLRAFLDFQPRDLSYFKTSEFIRANPRPWTFEEFLDEIKDLSNDNDHSR